MQKIRSRLARYAAHLRPRAIQVPGPSTLSRRSLGMVMVVGLAASLFGCAMFAPPPPKLAISIVAAAKLKPDSRARSSPVVVRIYELKSATQFASAYFMALFDQDRTVLASDIVVREEFVMQPGETKGIDELLAPETQAIGVVVAFRDLKRAPWRGVALLTPGKDNTVTTHLEGVFI